MILISSEKGFTLVELVAFIVIGAIILPASMVAITAVFNSFNKPDQVVKARFFAERKFAQLTNSSYASVSVTDETAEQLISDGGGLKWKWKIKYVDPATYNATTNPYFNEVATDKGYKVITVTIREPDDAVYVFPLLITDRPKP